MRLEEQYNLIPQPARLAPGAGAFRLTPATRIAAASASARPAAEFLGAVLRRATGLPLRLSPAAPGEDGSITLRHDPAIAHPEGYRLRVAPEAVEISAGTSQGLFYGVQTLRQLAPAEVEAPAPLAGIDWRLPAVEIEDEIGRAHV